MSTGFEIIFKLLFLEVLDLSHYNSCDMVIGVIGAGFAGMSFAINRKMVHPKDEIIVFEHLDKAMKNAILATKFHTKKVAKMRL